MIPSMMINQTIQTMLPRRSPQGFLIQIMIISRMVVSMQCSSPSRTIKFMALHRGEALVDGFPVKPMSARGAVPCLGQDVLSQAFCTGSYPKPLLESIVQFCRDKTSTDFFTQPPREGRPSSYAHTTRAPAPPPSFGVGVWTRILYGVRGPCPSVACLASREEARG